MAGGNPWKISALISACYEFVLALFLIFQMLLSIVVLELTKYLPMSQACSCYSHRHHNLFCSGHFPPFSPCRERNATRFKGIAGAPCTPVRFSRGLLPGRALSEDLQPSKNVGDHASTSKKVGFSDHARSLSLSSVYKRKKRTPSLEENTLFTQECKSSVDGDPCKCIVSEIDLYDDLIEVSSEYLKQKDRGHEEVILSLLKALQVERRNLRTLYEELEEERVASETAANETMGMILRLQEEKSALQMEAAHYQRMAEEKSLHDEQAIQLLEEDLCRKESERLLLEEELSLLRGRSYGDAVDVAEDVDDLSCTPEVSKPLLLLTGIDEASQQEEDESTLNPQDYTEQKCISVIPDESLEAGQVDDQPLKRLKSFIVHQNEISKDSSTSDSIVESVLIDSSKHPEKCQLFYDDDDAKTILMQLSALEKQLLALEESERLDSWHQVQAQAQEDHLTCVFLKPDGSCDAEDEIQDVSKQGDDSKASEAELLDEEKVVNVDVANVNDGPYCEAQVPAAEEILEFHEGQRSRSKVVQWEACEEEKHLDMPSFVPTSNSNIRIASNFEETCKPDVESLQGPSPEMCEEIKWNAKRVTLEGINLRLQALETESSLLRHRSVPSNHEHMSMVLLKEIMQELQEFLKANRNGSATNEALPSMNAYVKGGQHKKRHFSDSDGPGQLS